MLVTPYVRTCGNSRKIRGQHWTTTFRSQYGDEDDGELLCGCNESERIAGLYCRTTRLFFVICWMRVWYWSHMTCYSREIEGQNCTRHSHSLVSCPCLPLSELCNSLPTVRKISCSLLRHSTDLGFPPTTYSRTQPLQQAGALY
jgi:hypothetical protein